MSRFGTESKQNIQKAIVEVTPRNTVKTRSSIWNQFSEFCQEKNYKLFADTPVNQICSYLFSLHS